MHTAMTMTIRIDMPHLHYSFGPAGQIIIRRSVPAARAHFTARKPPFDGP